MASSPADEVARESSDRANGVAFAEEVTAHRCAEQSRGQGDDDHDDMIVISPSCGTKESFDSAPHRIPPEGSVLPVPLPSPPLFAPPESHYPHQPRCPEVANTDNPGQRRRKGQLVFKRLRREMDPPSPRHYKMMMCVSVSGEIVPC